MPVAVEDVRLCGGRGIPVYINALPHASSTKGLLHASSPTVQRAPDGSPPPPPPCGSSAASTPRIPSPAPHLVVPWVRDICDVLPPRLRPYVGSRAHLTGTTCGLIVRGGFPPLPPDACTLPICTIPPLSTPRVALSEGWSRIPGPANTVGVTSATRFPFRPLCQSHKRPRGAVTAPFA
jgi:hypothetical protein